jgi:histone deacetylase 1/2
VILVAIWVDDIITTSSSNAALNDFEEELKSEFSIKSLGNLHYFLGICVNRTDEGIQINQQAIIDKILERFKMETCSTAPTPMVEGAESSLGTYIEQKDSQQFPYRELIGSLMYLVVATRPDIAYAVAYLSQFLNKPQLQHWNYAKRILR